MAKTRVSDGARTRDNRNHNPPTIKQYQALARFRVSQALGESCLFPPVPAPGPGIV
jgi:hypothetical protein